MSPNEKMQALIEVRMAIDRAASVTDEGFWRYYLVQARIAAIGAIREYAASEEFRALEVGDGEDSYNA